MEHWRRLAWRKCSRFARKRKRPLEAAAWYRGVPSLAVPPTRRGMERSLHLTSAGLRRGGLRLDHRPLDRLGHLVAGLDPVLDALRIAQPRVLADRVEEHDDDRLARDVGHHDEATSRLADVAGLLQLDLPGVARDEPVRVVEAEHAAGGVDLDVGRWRRREFADQRVSGGRADHFRK